MDKNEETSKHNLKHHVARKYEQVKGHIKKHQTIYAFGGGVVVMAVTFVVTRRIYAPHGVTGMGTAVRARNIGNVFVWIAPKPRSLSYVVRCDQTNVVFRSQEHAAQVMKLPAAQISRSLNGLRSSVGGYTFTRLGIGA